MKTQPGAFPPSYEPPFAFCLMDSYMRFTKVSPMFAQLTGYSVEELSNMGAQEIVALESMETALESLERADELGWSHHEITFHKKDGTPVRAHIDTFHVMEDRYIACVREVECPGP